MNHLRKRRIAQKFETARLDFAVTYRELMREYKVQYRDIAGHLGLSVIKTRELINREPLTLDQMIALVDILNEAGTCHVIFVIPRP